MRVCPFVKASAAILILVGTMVISAGAHDPWLQEGRAELFRTFDIDRKDLNPRHQS
jgi:hypothetical protein